MKEKKSTLIREPLLNDQSTTSQWGSFLEGNENKGKNKAAKVN